MDIIESKAKGAMIGVAVGDALGASAEFMTRNEILHTYGILKEMVGQGHWKLLPGEVTDDTHMTIAVAKGIITNFENPIEDMIQFFIEWAKTEPKDIGNICRIVLREGIKKGIKHENEWLKIVEDAHNLSGKRSAGNGSLMRTMPVIIAYLANKEKMIDIALRQSALTHYDEIAGECVAIYCNLIRNIIQGGNLKTCIKEVADKSPIELNINLFAEQINTTGYVIHTLEAALNCAYQTDSLEDALVMAVNLGGDTDTIGAVTGGIVGANYGLEAIPIRWMSKLKVKEEIWDLTDKLLNL